MRKQLVKNIVSAVFNTGSKSKGQLPPQSELRKTAAKGMQKFTRKKIK